MIAAVLPLRRNGLSTRTSSPVARDAMAERCPVCSSDWAAGPAPCGRCGLPAALRERAARVLTARPEPDPAAPLGADDVPRTAPSVEVPSATEPAARRLLDQTDLTRRLGLDDSSVVGALVGAAADTLAGNEARALERLEEASGELDHLLSEGLAERLRGLREREAALEQAGIDLEGLRPTGTLDLASWERDQRKAASELVHAARALGGLEASWRDLQELRGEAVRVRELAKRLGIRWERGVGDREVPHRPVRLPASELERALREARGERERLAKAIGPALVEYVHGALERPERLGAALRDPLRLRELRERFDDQMRRDRLVGALGIAASLGAPSGVARRDEQRTAGTDATAESPAGSSAAESPAPSVTLDSLLAKARGLSSRIRTLPTDSERARRAATEIREATVLLRAGRLEEADATLTRLRHTLAVDAMEAPP